MRKLISKSIYKIYNLLQQNRLQSYYYTVKEHNDNHLPFEDAELKNFLVKWGFNENLHNNPAMHKKDVRNWLKKVDEKKVHNWAYTGGSYGEPLKVPYSRKRAFIRTATFKYFNELGGYNLGDSFALIRAKEKSSFIKFLRNETIVIPQDVSERKLLEILKTLKKKKITVLMGYPTVMFDMAMFLKKNPKLKEGLRINNLISVSEMADDAKRKVVREVFKCHFIDRYSNEEVGLIAQQREYGEPYYVNKYGVYVEVVDPITLKSVGEGETGKVLVTDIYNDLIPIVRYDTGDLAVVDKYKDGQLFSLKRIIGREIEKILDVRGNPISSLALGPSIYKPLANAKSSFQFQLAQTGAKSYELRLKNYGVRIDEEILDNIKNNLKKQLGAGADIQFKFVEDIPPQPSGKRPVYKYEIK